MEWIVVSLISSLAYVYAPLLRAYAARRLGIAMPAGAIAPGAEPLPAPPVEIPPTVEDWCVGWYDEATQQEQRTVARELFAQTQNWDVVLSELERLSGGNANSKH